MALAMVRKPEIPFDEMEALRHLLGRTWRRGSWPLADECVDVAGEAATEEDGRSSAPAPRRRHTHARPSRLRSECSRRATGSGCMTRYVIGPDVALRLARERAAISDEHQVLAPTLLRSHVLSSLYRAAQRGELAKKEADERLNYLRGLRIRLLGDRVLQSVAWKVADKLGWPDTFDAEYVALTQLQADAFVTLDQRLARAVTELVTVAPIEELY